MLHTARKSKIEIEQHVNLKENFNKVNNFIFDDE